MPQRLRDNVAQRPQQRNDATPPERKSTSVMAHLSEIESIMAEMEQLAELEKMEDTAATGAVTRSDSGTLIDSRKNKRRSRSAVLSIVLEDLTDEETEEEGDTEGERVMSAARGDEPDGLVFSSFGRQDTTVEEMKKEEEQIEDAQDALEGIMAVLSFELEARKITRANSGNRHLPAFPIKRTRK